MALFTARTARRNERSRDYIGPSREEHRIHMAFHTLARYHRCKDPLLVLYSRAILESYQVLLEKMSIWEQYAKRAENDRSGSGK
jgi:hypothetical protein